MTFVALITNKIMDNKNWISLKELISYLQEHPYCETECRLKLNGFVGSTHYWYWDDSKQCLMHSRDYIFTEIHLDEAFDYYGDSLWKIDQ